MQASLAMAAAALLPAMAASASQAPQLIDVDLRRISPVFTYDGHGGLADAGSSRLLMDYREPQRSQILDYLFLPSFGASLHMLKVEIAGDSQSTDGTGPSHMHHRHDHDGCYRGNAAWLIREAKVCSLSLTLSPSVRLCPSLCFSLCHMYRRATQTSRRTASPGACQRGSVAETTGPRTRLGTW